MKKHILFINLGRFVQAALFILSVSQLAAADDTSHNKDSNLIESLNEISPACPIERLKGLYKVISSQCTGRTCSRPDTGPGYSYLELGIDKFDNQLGYIKKYTGVPGDLNHVGGFKFLRVPKTRDRLITTACFEWQKNGLTYSEISQRYVHGDGRFFNNSTIFYQTPDGYLVHEIHRNSYEDWETRSKLEKTQ